MSTSELPPERADITKKLRPVKVEAKAKPEPEDQEPIDAAANTNKLPAVDVENDDPGASTEIDALDDSAEMADLADEQNISDASGDENGIDEYDEYTDREDERPLPVRRLRRKPTRSELIVFLIIIVLLIVICVSVLPFIGTLLQTIQFNDESSHLLLPILSA